MRSDHGGCRGRKTRTRRHLARLRSRSNGDGLRIRARLRRAHQPGGDSLARDPSAPVVGIGSGLLGRADHGSDRRGECAARLPRRRCESRRDDAVRIRCPVVRLGAPHDWDAPRSDPGCRNRHPRVHRGCCVRDRRDDRPRIARRRPDLRGVPEPRALRRSGACLRRARLAVDLSHRSPARWPGRRARFDKLRPSAPP